jgi:bacillopeptidase F (M6 metalloprotease family)
MRRDIALPTADVRMQFNIFYTFENHLSNPHGCPGNCDGGWIEVSTNGGATWADAGALITAGPEYGGVVDSATNPLAGREAWVGVSKGYQGVQLDLSSLTGQHVRFRFRVATDEGTADSGLFVDDIEIHRCD